MYSGSVKAFLAAAGLAAAVCLVAGSPAALAQTPDEACAADSLYLVSPEALVMREQVGGRPGLVISWRDLPTDIATCYTLTGLDNLGFQVDVEGGFGDKVDRILAFTTADSGSIGHQTRRPLLLSWQSQSNNPANGVLAGNVNLANNGGILHWNNGQSRWDQFNAGLPMTWLNTNITSLDVGTGGFMLAACTAGPTLDTLGKGLWVYRSGTWSRIADTVFTNNTVITQVAVSPTSNDYFAVGTSRNGLYVTRDGGATFTQFTSQLDPAFTPMPANFNVSALNWDSTRLFAFVPNFGLFVSNDQGVSFARSPIRVESNLDQANSPLVLPQINEISVDGANSDHVLVALNFNGVWESDDGGQSWHNLYGNLNVANPDTLGRWVHSAKSVTVDGGDSNVLVAGFTQEGLYRTADGGNTWTLVGNSVQPGGSGQSLLSFYVRGVPGQPGLIYSMEDNYGLLVSNDSGQTWQLAAQQPYTVRAKQMRVARDGSGDLLLASVFGGVYVPGTAISLSATYNTTTSSWLRGLDLGLWITFGTEADPGFVHSNDLFNLVCQTFQGWAIWRSPGHDRSSMTLLGMYDRVNPESCIEGYCGDVSYDIVPQCYVSKRAACFNFDTPDSVRFFDDEVYNGFSYYYAVTSFDYGNTAMVSPANNTNPLLFSPRFPGDEDSPFQGNGNIALIQINSSTADPANDDPIYVYPNPLRRDAGIPGSEGETVVFTNLPPQSRVRVFTTAGDDVINLGPDNMQEGNIYWRTVNREREPVAPGVYLYKVECPTREDYWGKLVIIR